MDDHTKRELEDLISDYIAGDASAIEPIVDLLTGPIASFLWTCGIPSDCLDEVGAFVIESLFDVKICKYKRKRGSAFWSWLCTVMVNMARDWHRQRKRLKNREIAEAVPEKIQKDVALEKVTPPSAELQPILKALSRALGTLSTEERELLRMRDIAGLSFENIAVITLPDASEDERARFAKSARVKIFRAEAKIRKHMEKDERIPRRLFEK